LSLLLQGLSNPAALEAGTFLISRLTHTSEHVLTPGSIKANLPQMLLFVLPLVPSPPPLGGFPVSPTALWSTTDPEIMCLPPKFGSTAARYNVSHNTPPQQSSATKHSTGTELQIQPGGFRIRSWKALSQLWQKTEETKRHARMLVASQERRKREGELLARAG